MPVARFQMPDGRVARFEVPEGTTPEQAQSMMQAHFAAPKAEPAPNPTDGMSAGEKFAAAAGSSVASGLRALGADRIVKSLGLPATKAEADALDAPLMKTKAGRFGSIAGTIGIGAPAMLVPGANTYLGASLLGAGMGGALTEGDLADRAKGALAGAAGGALGKGAGDLIGAGAKKVGAMLASRAAAKDASQVGLNAALKTAKDVGYVVTPSMAQKSGPIISTLEGLGGKIKTQQSASVKNQAVTDRLVRQSLGLAEDAPLTPETLNAVRQQAGQAYEALRGLGTVNADADLKLALQQASKQTQGASRSFPGLVKANPVDDIVKALDQPKFDAGDAIDAVRVLRDQADSFYTSGDKASGKAIKGIANALEDSLERAAQSTGNPQLVNGFREARKTIAKTYTVQSALGAGSVNAQKLASQLTKGKPLSGELKQVAQFSQAFPKATQSGVDVPAFSPLDMFSGGLGAGMGSVPLMAATASRPVTRSIILSKPVQNMLLAPAVNGPGLLARSSLGLLGSDATSPAFGLLGRGYAVNQQGL